MHVSALHSGSAYTVKANSSSRSVIMAVLTGQALKTWRYKEQATKSGGRRSAAEEGRKKRRKERREEEREKKGKKEQERKTSNVFDYTLAQTSKVWCATPPPALRREGGCRARRAQGKWRDLGFRFVGWFERTRFMACASLWWAINHHNQLV